MRHIPCMHTRNKLIIQTHSKTKKETISAERSMSIAGLRKWRVFPFIKMPISLSFFLPLFITPACLPFCQVRNSNARSRRRWRLILFGETQIMRIVYDRAPMLHTLAKLASIGASGTGQRQCVALRGNNQSV